MRCGLDCLRCSRGIPFDLAFSSKILEFNYQNVFFTLFIGLLTMIAYRAVEEKEEWNQALKVILYILIVAAGMALAYFLKTDYAEAGVFCIMVLYIFRKKKIWGCSSQDVHHSSGRHRRCSVLSRSHFITEPAAGR